MSGYDHHHFIRLRPSDGAASEIDLREALTDAGGPVRTTLRYDYEADDWEDVNRSRRQRKYGFRADVRLEFDVVDMADHRTLAKIASAAMADGMTIDLSLNGGATYREVLVTRAPSPRPFRGKTFAGAKFRIDFEAVELLDELPTLDAGGW